MDEQTVIRAQQGHRPASNRLVEAWFAPVAVVTMLFAAAVISLAFLFADGIIAPTSAQPPSDPDADESAMSYTVEPVEPGVYRFVDDGAGHDASDLPDWWKWLYKLAVAPDGTLWLPRLDEILHLGEEGFVENPIGPGALELDIDVDGDLWIRNGSEVLTPDGSVVGARQVETDPRIVEMVRHPDGGVIASLTYPDVRNELRHWTKGMEGLGELVAPPLRSGGTDWVLWDVTVDPDGSVWAIETRAWLETQEREAHRLLRTEGQGWEVVPLPEVGEPIEPLAIELAADGRLLVDLWASSPDPGLALEERRPIRDYGDGRWLGRLDEDGSWTAERIPVSPDPAWRWMAGTTPDHAWFPLGGTGSDCAGVAALGNDGVHRYLEDKCVYCLVVAPDHRVWVVASDHGGYEKTDTQLYLIEPWAVANRAADR